MPEEQNVRNREASLPPHTAYVIELITSRFRIFPERKKLMKNDKEKTSNVSERLKTVKAAWDKAPAGSKKDDALKHYQAAETAHKANKDVDANRELDAASRSLQ